MIKKLVPAFMVVLLAACANHSPATTSSNTATTATPVPTMKAQQSLSDEQVRQWVTEVNNAEHCMYPQLAGLNTEQATQIVYSKISPAELQLWGSVQLQLLKKVIGEQAFVVLSNDMTSLNQARAQFLQLNHQNVTGMSATECALFKQEFSARLAATTQSTQGKAAVEKKAKNFSF
ncbi:DUF5358 domain-containing protein [Pelistega suis]|uniref:DUF5358 domain-containing protein n=1 Tax=Pelistega suis TaxID=1631957 RepID=UPI00211C977D|nr:DUF5358 domain-containing protein [Pelistega suis]MCQ9329110.1 DUF5358 domain-containing protein [Pelistega suis]